MTTEPLHAQFTITCTPFGVRLAAPCQTVPTREFQPPAFWAVMMPIERTWKWSELRKIFDSFEALSDMGDFSDRTAVQWAERLLAEAQRLEPIMVEAVPSRSALGLYTICARGAWTHLSRGELLRIGETSNAELELAEVRARAAAARITAAGRVAIVMTVEPEGDDELEEIEKRPARKKPAPAQQLPFIISERGMNNALRMLAGEARP